MVSETFFVDHILKNKLGHGAAADVAVADEKYSYHIFLTPISSWIFSVFPYFMGLCAHFQSIDHFPISRLIFVYLGIFIPPNGLNIGLKWTIFSSLDH